MGGALDWADPCVDAQNNFKSTAEAARRRADDVITEWDARTDPPDEMRILYVDAIKEAAYKSWFDDPQTKPLIAAVTAQAPDFDSRKFFFDKVYSVAVTPEKEKAIVQALYQNDYKTKFRPEMQKSRDDLEKQISSEQEKMDGACRPDLVSQLFRGTIGNALAILGNNWKAAEREPGEIAKFVRITSGVSISDIAANGLQGGANSEVNKILGGDNSALRLAIRNLDPGTWKVDLPEITVHTHTVDVGGIKFDLPF
jgi:hypothetical protein